MSVVNLTRVPVYVWVPPQYTGTFKITVESSDGTVTDISDELISFKIEDGTTETIGNFEFLLPNPNETYTSLWSGMEIFRFYADYAAEATTLRFRGRIEKPSNQNNNLKVTGRSEALFVVEANVTKSYGAVDTAEILLDLFNTYGGSRFDTSLIPSSTGTSLTVNWVDRPFWDCVKDLCSAVTYDCYVDCNLFVRYFSNGSVNNDTEGIVHEYNLLEVGDFAPDLSFVKNKIRVYGATIDGVQVFYTANDSASQSTHGIRVENVNDDNILDINTAKETGDFILAERKNPPIIGDVKSIILPTIQPGENIWISAPMENLQPNRYMIQHFIHEYSDEGLFTTVTINKEPRKISHLFKTRVENENKKQDSSSNSDNLDFSYTEFFNADSGTHSTTEIVDGRLKLSSGSSGSWTSAIFASVNSSNVVYAKLLVTGENISGMSFELSVDAGINYESISVNSLLTVSSAVGYQMVLRVTFSSATSQLDSFAIQYSTE